MRGTFFGLVAVALTVANARAEDPKAADAVRARAGEYVEIDPAGVPNENFSLTVQDVTPNIVLLRGKNGWICFATFDAEKKEYRGAFEWPDTPGGRPGGKWGDLYHVRLTTQDGVLKIEGKSKDNDLLIRARPK